jgi:GT2 family glycosyltransferase
MTPAADGATAGDHRPEVSVIVLAFGAEPLLERCIASVLDPPHTEVVLVDNGCTTDAVAEVEGTAGVRVLRPPRNLGFAGGCNLAALHARGAVVVLLNSDAIAQPGAVAALASALSDPTVGIATASVRFLDRPELLNSSGNPVHFTGTTWAGNLGRPGSMFARSADVASASGAAMAVRTTDWQRWEGFWDEMFAYCEDTELSLRCWLEGSRVVYVPEAVVLHDYEFSRNPHKFFLVERNRLLMLLTVYETRTLAILALPLAAFELAVLTVALRQGWARQKLTAWWWLVTHRSDIRARRALVQRARRRRDAALVPLLAPTIDPAPETGMSVPAWASTASRVIWRWAARAIVRDPGRGGHLPTT